MKRIILKPGEEKRILGGHPWVYDNEVDRILDSKTIAGPGGVPVPAPAALESGEIADVESSRKEYLGRAFVNPHSKIIARIYSPSKEGVDKGFFKRRIREALLRRAAIGSNDLSRSSGFCYSRFRDGGFRESARIVFGEADFLPGLIIDRYVGWPLADLEAHSSERPLTFDAARAALGPPASWLSVQFLCYGMDSRRGEILAALEEVLSAPLNPSWDTPLGAPAGIIEKSTAKVRELEGLPLQEGIIRGTFPVGGIVIFENGFPFAVNLEEGQKTGHYLDQRENRLCAAGYVSTMSTVSTDGTDGTVGTQCVRILDVCAYTGGFSVHAARIGAACGIDTRITAVDVSAAALEMARKNAALNRVGDRIETVEADLFNLLPLYERAKERFDLIILDPPAFAKSHSALEGAVRGYKEINLRALTLLSKGGVLVTCSCSQAMDEGRFKRMIAEAAADAEVRLQLLDFRYQAADHPVLVGYDESLYLKCGIYRVV